MPHLGGSAATVAVTAARHGAHVALAGGAGDDGWGRWLRDRLRREGVGLSQFELVPGTQTPVALVAVDCEGDPSREVYGERRIVSALDERLEDEVRSSAALFIVSAGPEDNKVMMQARELALSLGRPSCSRPSSTCHGGVPVPRRRQSRTHARPARCWFARVLAIRADDGRRRSRARGAGAVEGRRRLVVITLGLSEGAILRGELRLDADDVPTATVVSTIGAGDVLTGILLARLATSAFYPAAVAASLPEAVAQAAQACERWGALE